MAEVTIKKAAFISAVSKYSSIILNLAFSAVLARLLTPEDYGIVAVTAVFTTFFTLFADMGIGAGVIQNKELTQDDINSIYTFTVRISIILAIVFVAFSFPMSWFYKEHVYVPMGMLLALSLFFSAMNIVPNALLLKEKRFVAVGIRTIVVCVFSGVVGIVFALLGFKYYALVLQNIFNAFFIFVWNYVSTRPKLVRKICRDSINKIKNYSSFLFGFNIINYFARNSDNLLISKFMGTAALGYYDKAYKLMLYPVGNLTHVITPVLHPILSEHQNDKDYIYVMYMKIIKILSLLGAFIMNFCFFNADAIIQILFGEKWLVAVPCFRYMSISIWAQMITSSCGSIFQSIGDSKRLFFSGTLNSVFTVCAIIFGCIDGSIECVARNIGLIYLFHFVSTYVILIHFSFKKSFFLFIKELIPDFIIIVLLFACGVILNLVAMNVFIIQNVIIKCSFFFFCFSVVYVFLLLLFRQMKYFKMLVRRK